LDGYAGNRIHCSEYQVNNASERSYRLIDGSCQLHLQLDSHYSSLDDAIADAIVWIGDLSEPDHPSSLIGVEVSIINDDWRTCRLPGPLLCPLPR
jgi:hypothetical protein